MYECQSRRSQLSRSFWQLSARSKMGGVTSCQMVLLPSVMSVLLSAVIGQQLVGVSLKFRGVTIPNGSFVDIGDIMYTAPSPCCNELPSNTNPRDEALLCVSDLIDCCDSPRTVRGDWYYPDGRRVELNPNTTTTTFRANRGPNELINGRQFYGSVRLFRRYSTPPERGRFRCELPSAADPNVNQTLYANIVNFRESPSDSHPVTISLSGSSTAGEIYSLTCSATLLDPIPLPSNVPPPTFEWFFGPNNSALLPSGVAATGTTSSSSTYISTLQFFPLSQSHTGNYKCQLGAASLGNNNMVTVTAPFISAVVTANLSLPLVVGQTGNTLTCGVFGADRLNPTVAYHWTRDGETIQDGSSSTLNLSPLRLSQAGVYTCRTTVSSTLLSGNIQESAGNTQTVTIQIPDPQSVMVTSSIDSVVSCGSSITVNCTVELGPAVMKSELSLLIVSAQLSRDGTPLNLTGPTLTGTTFNFGASVSFFSKEDTGNYTCTATVTPRPSSAFLTGMGQLESSPLEITIGIPPSHDQLPESSGNTRGCSASDIAIAVVVTSLIECLLAAPIIAALLAFCWKRNQRRPQYKSTGYQATTTITKAGDVNPGEDVYEEPDIKPAVATTPEKFKLSECPAYVTTTSTLQLYAATEAQLQSGYYEL